MVQKLAIFALFCLSAGCAEKIGDSCTISTDCSSAGDRTCDRINSPGGYCTIIGCAHDSCPEEAVCVRFYVIGNASQECTAGAAMSQCGEGEKCSPAGGCIPVNTEGCDPAQEDRAGGTDNCDSGEACTLAGACVPSSAERTFCMAKCGGPGDCRSEYECRDEGLMKRHGGEPVPVPGADPAAGLQGFCAVTGA